jgi:hypothetical protein
MLFHKKTKGIIKAIWMVLAVLIIISMIVLYIPLGY